MVYYWCWDRTNGILITINNYTPLDVLPEGVNFVNGFI
jgi:hypothetical protein